MPGKSRRKRGKHIQASKTRSRQHAGPAAQVQATSKTPEPVFRNTAAPRDASVTRPSASPGVIQHPYITSELRTIGVLTVIMIIILFVLYIVLT